MSILTGVLSTAGSARAAEPEGNNGASPPSPGATEQARLVYERAVTAYTELRYKDAVDLFQQADTLRPNPAFSFNIGIAYEDMGDSAMALRHYRAYLRKLPQATDRDDVEDRIRRLERGLADKGLQQVTILSDPANATVMVDSKPLGLTPWTGEMSPGHHLLRLHLQGYEDAERDFDLPARRAIDVPVTLRVAQMNSDVKAIDMSENGNQNEERELWQHIRPLTWGVLGVGIVSFGGALGFELARADFEQQSQSEPRDAQRTNLHERALQQEVWAKGFLMMGLGLGVTSIVLGYQDVTDGLQAQRRSGVSLGCGSAGDCALGFRGVF